MADVDGDGRIDYQSSSWSFDPSDEEVMTALGEPCRQGSRLMCSGWVVYEKGDDEFWTPAVYRPLSYTKWVPTYFTHVFPNGDVRLQRTGEEPQTFRACNWYDQYGKTTSWCHNNVYSGRGLYIPHSVEGPGAYSGVVDTSYNYCANDTTTRSQYSRVHSSSGTIYWTNGTNWWSQTSAGVWHRL